MLFCKHQEKAIINTDGFSGSILSVAENESGLLALFYCNDLKSRLCIINNENLAKEIASSENKFLKLKPFMPKISYMAISYCSSGKIAILDNNLYTVDTVYPKINFNNGYLNCATCVNSSIILCYGSAVFKYDGEYGHTPIASSQNSNVFIDAVICENYCWTIEYFLGGYFLNTYEYGVIIHSEPMPKSLCISSLSAQFCKEANEFTVYVSAYSNNENYLLLLKYGI